jgi:hypothetical protein
MIEWWERPVRVSVDSWPTRHPLTNRLGEWQGRYLPESERTPDGYETEDVWVDFCEYHQCVQPCHRCEAASLGLDEGDET